MAEKLLDIKGLTAWYDPNKKILKEFCMDLNKNEVVGLIGLNGAGKSTFMKVLTGLLKTYEVKGKSYLGKNFEFRDNAYKKTRYMVFAEDASFGYFTFREYITYVGKTYGKKLQNVEEMIEGFHFKEYENTLLKDLSTGNQKKAFLITGFALQP